MGSAGELAKPREFSSQHIERIQGALFNLLSSGIWRYVRELTGSFVCVLVHGSDGIEAVLGTV